MSTSNDLIANLGPLAPLAGIWQGDKGVDIAPTPTGSVESHFREHLVLEPFGPVNNRDQVLYGLRYSTTAWRLGEQDSFHEELGYWLWDAANGQVMRAFLVPRGVAVMAGGEVSATSRDFTLTAEVGSATYGALSNPFLHASANTQAYEVTISIHGDDSFTYVEDTVLNFTPLGETFHHTDRNTLTRVT